jgi:limonene-1,2-epoxide hydrolase
MTNSKSLIDLVQTFLTAANQNDSEKGLAMFNDNAEFELVGVYRVEGKEQIRNVFEYDAGVHTKLEFSDPQVEGDMVKGWLVERNDRLAAIGFNKLDYPFCAFPLQRGRRF